METELGYDLQLIGIAALVFAVGTFSGSVVWGNITDRKDTMKRYIILSLLYVISIIFGLSFVNYRNFNLELVFFFFVGVFGGAFEAYQLKVIQEETTENLESTIFSIYTGVSNIGQFAMGSVIVVVMADAFDISILLSMQFIIVFIIISIIYLNQLKFVE